MAKELRCLECGGALGWAGSQVSCRACGTVYTAAGKPGSKFGVLIARAFIGIILGTIGGVELSRFILSSDAERNASEAAVPGQNETP